jgi:HPt (histidine-containing phosphotransfer) domain-containing protein
MSEDDKLQQQLADIGTRYLKRTLGEVEELRVSLEAAQAGSDDALVQLGQMAHKIHGSGAMFGFEALSERAYEIEQLARDGRGESTLQRIHVCVLALEEEVRRQAQLRDVQ